MVRIGATLLVLAAPLLVGCGGAGLFAQGRKPKRVESHEPPKLDDIPAERVLATAVLLESQGYDDAARELYARYEGSVAGRPGRPTPSIRSEQSTPVSGLAATDRSESAPREAERVRESDPESTPSLATAAAEPIDATFPETPVAPDRDPVRTVSHESESTTDEGISETGGNDSRLRRRRTSRIPGTEPVLAGHWNRFPDRERVQPTAGVGLLPVPNADTTTDQAHEPNSVDVVVPNPDRHRVSAEGDELRFTDSQPRGRDTGRPYDAVIASSYRDPHRTDVRRHRVSANAGGSTNGDLSGYLIGDEPSEPAVLDGENPPTTPARVSPTAPPVLVPPTSYRETSDDVRHAGFEQPGEHEGGERRARMEREYPLPRLVPFPHDAYSPPRGEPRGSAERPRTKSFDPGFRPGGTPLDPEPPRVLTDPLNAGWSDEDDLRSAHDPRSVPRSRVAPPVDERRPYVDRANRSTTEVRRPADRFGRYEYDRFPAVERTGYEQRDPERRVESPRRFDPRDERESYDDVDNRWILDGRPQATGEPARTPPSPRTWRDEFAIGRPEATPSERRPVEWYDDRPRADSRPSIDRAGGTSAWSNRPAESNRGRRPSSFQSDTATRGYDDRYESSTRPRSDWR